MFGETEKIKLLNCENLFTNFGHETELFFVHRQPNLTQDTKEKKNKKTTKKAKNTTQHNIIIHDLFIHL